MRWKITVVLGIIALFSAALAPRLLQSEKACSGPPVATAHQAIPEATQPLAIPAAIPEATPSQAGIPEAQQPITPRHLDEPIEPELPSAWDDCPGCGMG